MNENDVFPREPHTKPATRYLFDFGVRNFELNDATIFGAFVIENIPKILSTTVN